MLLRCLIILLMCLKIVLTCDVDDNPARRHIITKSAREMRTQTSKISLIKNSTANMIELSEKGRILMKHYVTTCDGYILTVFRLTWGNGTAPKKRYPVLLAHGMFQSSDRFIDQRKDQSLAFLLQDQGYDVWLANARGNKYGRNHFYLEPEADEKTDFFDYTYEEIAFYDISVTIDYILNDTLKDRLHYIGHSLGGTAFLVLNSLNPKYNHKFDSAHLMAPVGYQKYFPNSKLLAEANRFGETYKELLKQGTVEIFPYKPGPLQTDLFSESDCLGSNTYENICRELQIRKMMGLNSSTNKINETRGGSIKTLLHLAQNIRSKSFSRFDYGQSENERHYGTKQPPKYDLSLVNVPTTLIYAVNDEYVSHKDISDMANDMGYAMARQVERSNFKHEDFVSAPDVMQMVYEDILNDLNRPKKISKLRNTESPDIPDLPGGPLWWRVFLWVYLPIYILPVSIAISCVIFFCKLKNVSMNLGADL